MYVVVILAGSLVHTIPRLVNKRHNGYYKYNNTVYYNYSDNWYYYDDLGFRLVSGLLLWKGY